MISFHNKVKNCFDRSATNYDLYANVQTIIGAALISQIKGGVYKNIVDLGCGTGMTTRHLCNNITYDHLYLCDISSSMRQKASEKVAGISLSFNFDNDWKNLPHFDLIFSNMAMQWSLHMESLLQKCFKHLTPGGQLAFSLPLAGTFSQLDVLGININKFLSLKDIETYLKKTGFLIDSLTESTYKEPYGTLLEGMRCLKGMGAHHVHQRKKRPPLKKNLLNLPGVFEYKIGLCIGRKAL